MVKKIGELTPERTTWIDDIYFAGYDAADPANPDPKISMGSLRTAAATFTNKTLGSGSVWGVDVQTTQNLGSASAGAVATEYGDARHHMTSLTLTTMACGTSGDNAAKATGGLLYTLPAGVILMRACYIAVGVTIADAIKTDTPEFGLGTTLASGVFSTLGAAGATTENLFEGQALADVNGTVLTQTKLPTTIGYPFLIEAADVHTVYMNLADTWADLTAESALTADGTIVLVWDWLA